MAQTAPNRARPAGSSALAAVIQDYQGWVQTVAGYRKRTEGLLDSQHADQDRILAQLRKLCSRARCVRHADFDAVFRGMMLGRQQARDSLRGVVEAFRTERQAELAEAIDALAREGSRAEVEHCLRTGCDRGVERAVADMRQVLTEQEGVTAALREMLERKRGLDLDGLRAAADRLARDGVAERSARLPAGSPDASRKLAS